jgi:hypothetical protein
VDIGEEKSDVEQSTGNSGTSSGNASEPVGVVEPPEYRGRGWNKHTLTPFRKGQSGNPAGRPKGILTAPLTKLVGKRVPEELLMKLSPGASAILGKRPTVAQLIAWMHIQSALTGDSANIRELYNRLEGRNPATVNLNTTDKLGELRAALMAGPMEPGTSHPPQEGDTGDDE